MGDSQPEEIVIGEVEVTPEQVDDEEAYPEFCVKVWLDMEGEVEEGSCKNREPDVSYQAIGWLEEEVLEEELLEQAEEEIEGQEDKGEFLVYVVFPEQEKEQTEQQREAHDDNSGVYECGWIEKVWETFEIELEKKGRDRQQSH